jgi:transposase-like protein
MGGAPSPFPCGHTPHILHYWRRQHQHQTELTLQQVGVWVVV